MGQRGLANRDADQAMVVDNKWPHELLKLLVAVLLSESLLDALDCATLPTMPLR